MAQNRHFYQGITRRRWDDIRSRWSAHIPFLIDVGQPPNQTLSDFFVGADMRPSASPARMVMPGIHEIAMTEAIFLFQKSMHVARAVEASARKGMLSWAVFQGYHSAYYSAKGFLSLLGACFPQPAGRQLLVDLFPLQIRRKQPFGGEEEVTVTNCTMLEQNLLWGFFGRLLRVTEFGPNFRKHTVFLEGLDHEHIPRPRNRFIYHESHWPYADLTGLQKVADFAFRDSLEADLVAIEEDNPLFLAALGMVVPSLLRLMFDELMDRVPALGPHINTWTPLIGAQKHKCFVAISNVDGEISYAHSSFITAPWITLREFHPRFERLSP